MASSLPLIVLLLCCVGLAHSYLRVSNLRAQNLRLNKYSKPDGYVKVYYGSIFMGQTSFVRGNRDPSWPQSFNYYSAKLGGRLTVKVYDKNAVFDDYLGGCTTVISKRGIYSGWCNLSTGGTLYLTYSFI
ncbi:PREDICTED: perforin-1-like [Poecilia mexicana]|uniref:C2 domain-containing protein n=1 Tax=Poecilia mexicana TaxID=48701 RepID=A0A3B3XS03_9TELE|nr:PREDICTED: perforin-1-like [Poecilia mexicana]